MPPLHPTPLRPAHVAAMPAAPRGLGRWGWALGLLWAGTVAQAAALTVSVQGASGQALEDAVLLLEPLSGKATVKPASGVEIRQQDKRFVPAVSVVPVGSRVAFPNLDTVRHHVYSFSEAKKFELKLYAGRPENPVLFDRAGVVVLGCNIHDQMVGWIVVADTPWHAKTAANGRALLADVPAGTYRLRAWHPDLPAGSPGVAQPLTVAGADLAPVLQLPVGRP